MLFDLGGGFVLAMLVGLLAIYVYYSYCLYKIAQRTNTQWSWLSFIPLANFVYQFYIAKFPWWLTLICTISIFAPDGLKIIYLIYVIGFIFAWTKISQQLRRPSWWGILMIISPVNLVIMGLLAFKEVPQQQPSATTIL